jgi:hypothetical protein
MRLFKKKKEKKILSVKRVYEKRYHGPSYWRLYFAYTTSPSGPDWEEHAVSLYGRAFHEQYYKLVREAIKNYNDLIPDGDPRTIEMAMEEERVTFQETIDKMENEIERSEKLVENERERTHEAKTELIELQDGIEELLDIKEKHYTLLRMIEMPKRTLEKFNIS